MSELADRLSSAVRRRRIAAGAVAGVAHRGARQLAAAGLANADTATPMTAGTPVRVASLTKPIVAAAAVIACRDAPGAFERPIPELVPELRDAWRAAPHLSLRHLLSHTSGLHPELDLDVLRGLGTGDDALFEAARLVVLRGQRHRPGAAWQYCNGGFWLAGAVLGRLRGTTFEAAVEDLVLRPAGMTGTGFDTPPDGAIGHRAGRVLPHEYPRARRPGGGLWSTAGDLLRFADFLLGDADLLGTVTAPVAWTLRGTRYGAGWGVADRHARVVFHDGAVGGFRSRLVMVPAQRYAAAAVVNDEGGDRVIRDVLGADLRAATGQRPPPTPVARLPVVAYAAARLAYARATRGRS